MSDICSLTSDISPEHLFRRRRVNNGPHLAYGIGREAALGGVVADHFFVGGVVDAVYLVVGHIAVDPLNLRPHFLQHAAGGLRDGLQLVGVELAGARDFAFDDILGHDVLVLVMVGGQVNLGNFFICSFL